MATTSWQVRGQYYETCNCDFVCPCILQQMSAAPSKGECLFAMAFKIDRGAYGAIPLDGLGFIVLGKTPEAMIKGNWSVGVLVDDRATADQRDAIGRDPSAELVITERMASRAHGKIERRLDKFVLTDHSANGTFVTIEGDKEIILRREEFTLRGHGWIAFGQSRGGATDVVEFFCE